MAVCETNNKAKDNTKAKYAEFTTKGRGKAKIKQNANKISDSHLVLLANWLIREINIFLELFPTSL